MPTRFQAALGHRTRGQQVPTLRLLAMSVTGAGGGVESAVRCALKWGDKSSSAISRWPFHICVHAV